VRVEAARRGHGQSGLDDRTLLQFARVRARLGLLRSGASRFRLRRTVRFVELTRRMPGVRNSVGYGNVRKHGNHPKNGRHAIRQRTDDNQHHSLRPLEEPYLATRDRILGACSGVARQHRPRHHNSRQHNIEEPINTRVVDEQPHQQDEVGVAVEHGIKEPTEARDLIALARHRTINQVENRKPFVAKHDL